MFEKGQDNHCRQTTRFTSWSATSKFKTDSRQNWESQQGSVIERKVSKRVPKHLPYKELCSNHIALPSPYRPRKPIRSIHAVSLWISDDRFQGLRTWEIWWNLSIMINLLIACGALWSLVIEEVKELINSKTCPGSMPILEFSYVRHE